MAGEEGLGPCLVSAAADPARPYCRHPEDLSPLPLAPEALAFLQYTSGSTSAPRGVMVSHRMLAANLKQIRHAFSFGPDDRIAGWLPHYHDMGLIGGILTPVHLGIPNAMMSPAAFLRNPMRYLELAGQTRATVIGGPNFGFEHCLRHVTPEALARVDLSSLRLCFSGAETIRAETVRRFQAVFGPCRLSRRHWVGCYGLAEATLCVSVTPPGDGARTIEVETVPAIRQRIVSGAGAELVESGVPALGLDLAIVDPEARTRLSVACVGEIWLRGPNVAAGYWGNPETSAEVFDQRLDGEGGWLRTGDLGALRDGRLFVTGRIKELVVVRGQNHYPQDIEATVAAAHADILPDRVAAFPLDVAADGALGLACELDRRACRAPRPEPIFAAIRAAVGEAHGLMPKSVALLRPGTLPVTPSGKLQRFACREGLSPSGSLPVIAAWHAAAADASIEDGRADGALAEALLAAPPALRRGKLLAHLRGALAQAAGGNVDISDGRRFFDIGLDSVSGVALVAELERALDIALDPTLIYEHPTPAALADHLLVRLVDPAGIPRAAGAAGAPDDEMRALETLLASDP